MFHSFCLLPPTPSSSCFLKSIYWASLPLSQLLLLLVASLMLLSKSLLWHRAAYRSLEDVTSVLAARNNDSYYAAGQET